MPLSIHLFCAMWPECIDNVILTVLQPCVCRIWGVCFQVIKNPLFLSPPPPPSPPRWKANPKLFKYSPLTGKTRFLTHGDPLLFFLQSQGCSLQPRRPGWTAQGRDGWQSRAVAHCPFGDDTVPHGALALAWCQHGYTDTGTGTTPTYTKPDCAGVSLLHHCSIVILLWSRQERYGLWFL